MRTNIIFPSYNKMDDVRRLKGERCRVVKCHFQICLIIIIIIIIEDSSKTFSSVLLSSAIPMRRNGCQKVTIACYTRLDQPR